MTEGLNRYQAEYGSMNKLNCLLIVLSLASFVGCGTNRFEEEVKTEEAAIKLVAETMKGGYQLVSTKDLKQWLEDEDELLLIDAMPGKDSFAKGHIRTAINFTFPKEVMDSWNDDVMDGHRQEDFRQILGDATDRKIVVYCGYVKCARSHNAAICAQELGFTNVYRYPGGLYAWRGAGNQVTTK